ncbi:hypothetical protein E5720_12480 [Rhodococcus sp. PAMC28707]|uniref:hypothetical protein n=1 Tax=unclassified Rhodococcus (in: high G+C Gram-positive bacteria) TaxID=192944 RepID=UPI00109DB0FD|nr:MULTISPECIES: hypothetical protein [unclassified Rhodococcus (in: high G+C Gram-positive bacteria)]QCB49121.1 hypothetical protein E5769_01535 [Rhodococcus sp. PAMC28705]QCB59191.1 hypothetical protein E5720_12480 [Rhodococcus sp. PAMC28707]
MLEPSGPLPPEIYWRRRALAIGAAVVVLGLIVWFISSLSGSNEEPPQAEPAGVVTSPGPDATPSASAAAKESGASSAGSGAGSGASASGGSASGGSGSGRSTSSGASTTASKPAGAAAVPSNQCSDQSLAIKATPDKASYKVGEEPGFTVVITNISSLECQRDVGAGLQQALVYTLDDLRIWSNTDCFPDAQSDLRTFKPGEQAGFTVKWSGTNSVPGCGEERIPVGVGSYKVIAQLGELRSSPEPFNMT